MLENDLSLLVGLTGGMGSGKTLASSYFQESGAYILDADLVCRQLVEPGQSALSEISDRFGKDVIDASGKLDRKKLGQIVFSNPKRKEELESILHPKVFEFEKNKYRAICQKDPKALVIVDAALLIESGNFKKMDKVIVVNTDEKTRIRRILSRSQWSYDDVVSRIKNQMSSEEKIKYAHFVLENSMDKCKLREQVIKLHAKLSLLAENDTKETIT